MTEKPKWTEHQLRLWNAVQIWESIRCNPGIILTDGTDYATATELEELGLVVSVTHNDGEDTWNVNDLVRCGEFNCTKEKHE